MKYFLLLVNSIFLFSGCSTQDESVLLKEIENAYTQKESVSALKDQGTMTGFKYLGEKVYSCGGQKHTIKEYIHIKTGIEFALIPSGNFQMGSNSKDEKPIHQVRVNSFLLAKYEITQKLWKDIMGNNPSDSKGDSLPIENVSWIDSNLFCNALGFRLPTEAEWEYACRAGTNSEYYWGNSMNNNYAWHQGNSSATKKVGQKKPNAFGLYDMSGNVWEWCFDWYDEDYYSSSPTDNPQGPSSGSVRVLRGGSYFFLFWYCKSSFRSSLSPAPDPLEPLFNTIGYRGIGFRPCIAWKPRS